MKAVVPVMCVWMWGCGGTTDPADVTETITEDIDTTQETDTEPEVIDPPWYEGAVMYEVFVRSFQDSDGDGIGDLRGLVDRLDYLNDGVPGGDDLEIDGLWLMPIFAATSYHGYDTIDYDRIDPAYGTMADFEALIAACEARGIKVVLDLVMNHTGVEHPWFLEAKTVGAPKRDWYVWRADDPGWKQPFAPNSAVWHALNGAFYYGVFWGGMPDLNYREPAVIDAMTGYAKTWLERGAHGFRLDAARYLVETEGGQLSDLPETHAFWKTLRAELATSHPESYLVGEVWTSRGSVASYHGGGAELHQAFDFDLQSAILRALDRRDASWLRQELGFVASSGAPWTYSATFIGNHDLDRLSRSLDDSKQRAAAFLLLTLPGTPYLYYGDELGLKSSPALGDPAKRGPMPWSGDTNHGFTTGTPWLAFGAEADTRHVAAALADPNSLLGHYRALIRTRKAHPALSGPGITAVAHADTEIFATLRHDVPTAARPAAGPRRSGPERASDTANNEQAYLTIINLGNAPKSAIMLNLSAHEGILGAGPWNLQVVFGQDRDRTVDDRSALDVGDLAPHEGRIYRLR